MTTGSKLTDLTSSTWTGILNYPSMTYSNVSYQPVGFRWEKSWSGSDYGPEPLTSIFQKYWSKVDVASSSGYSPRLKYTYLDRWLLRKGKPRRKFQGEHNYSCSISMWSDAVYQYYTTSFYPPYAIDSRGWRTFRQVYGEGFTTTGSWTSNDSIALRGKLRERIVGSDFNLGVSLAEGKEALDLISNSAIVLADCLRALRRGDIGHAYRRLGIVKAIPSKKSKTFSPEEISSRWLEVQYGWLPLIGDAHGGAQALAQQLNNPMVQTYRARMWKPLVATPTSWTIRDGGDWGYRGKTRGQLIARVTEVDVPQLNGLTDPASIAWELLPYSFVADWFIPIGSYLEARGLASALSGTFIETKTVREAFYCYALKPSTVQHYEVNPLYRMQRISVDRVVSTSLSVPLPTVKPLSEVLNWRRATSAVALLVTGFSSHSSKR